MRSQARSQSGNNLLACQNGPKVVLKTCSKPASHLRALDHKLSVWNLTHSRSEEAHVQPGSYPR